MSSKFHYKISFRLVNIAIADSIHLSSSITLRSLTPSDIRAKYDQPGLPPFFHLCPEFEEHIHEHNVELVFDRTGTEEDYNRDISVEGLQALERSVTDAILIAMPCNIPTPYAIRALIEPSESLKRRETIVTLRHVGDFTYHPTPLSDPQVTDITSMYGILARSQNDRILTAAVDRLIIGKRGDLHHISKINEPNWDKVVDYVIGLETLFLTVNGNPISQELAYRFRLNGSTLLAACTHTDRRQLFDALNLLYEIRSSVVHGQAENATRKKAEKFIKILQIDEKEHRHPVGRLDIICRQLEDWFKMLLGHLDALDPEQRPYRAEGAWENSLWH
jgi:hypothetical protein